MNNFIETYQELTLRPNFRGMILALALGPFVSSLWSTDVRAQFAEPSASGGDGSFSAPSTNGLEGYWSGYVLCDTRGWAVFHHVQSDQGRLSSDYRYFGGSAGRSNVDIFGAGSVFLFDARENGVYDYEYTLTDGILNGVDRAGNNCTSRLHPLPKAVFEALP